MSNRLMLEPKVAKSLFDIIHARHKEAARLYQLGGAREVNNWLSTWIVDEELSALYSKFFSTTARYFARRHYLNALQETRSLKSLSIVKNGVSVADLWQRAIEEYVARHGVRFVSGINETTRNEIVQVLVRAAQEGWDENTTIMALKDKRIPLIRASRIARTEITRAASAGALLAANSVPFLTQKQWITANDERVRGNPAGQNSDAPFSHFVLHEIIIPLESSFFNGEQIRFPADPQASAANVVNCRCALSIVPIKDGRGRPVPRTVNETDILQALLTLL